MAPVVHLRESGDYPGRLGLPSGSRYVVITTVTVSACTVGNRVCQAFAGDGDFSHCFGLPASQIRTDAVRQRVLDAVGATADLVIDSTVFEKRSADGAWRPEANFFLRAARAHLFHVVRKRAAMNGPLTVVATYGTKRREEAFRQALRDSVRATQIPQPQGAFRDTLSQDACLWLADLCSWALQRRWEKDDGAWANRIRARCSDTFDYFGQNHLKV